MSNNIVYDPINKNFVVNKLIKDTTSFFTSMISSYGSYLFDNKIELPDNHTQPDYEASMSNYNKILERDISLDMFINPIGKPSPEVYDDWNAGGAWNDHCAQYDIGEDNLLFDGWERVLENKDVFGFYIKSGDLSLFGYDNNLIKGYILCGYENKLLSDATLPYKCEFYCKRIKKVKDLPEISMKGVII